MARVYHIEMTTKQIFFFEFFTPVKTGATERKVKNKQIRPAMVFKPIKLSKYC